VKAVILAAGKGSRLGLNIPKAMVSLLGRRTILDYQLAAFRKYFKDFDITVVTGFKGSLIRRRFPSLCFVENVNYEKTGTGKSLLCALENLHDEDVLWVNGDVYFESGALDLMIKSKASCSLADHKKCGDEEIKYNLHEDGSIRNLSKQVQPACGEALGVNLIRKDDLQIFKKSLQEIGDMDYFEKAIENLTVSKRLRFTVVSVESFFCQEIDFPEDLNSVRAHIATSR